MKKKITFIIVTRPEAIKLSPVINKFNKSNLFDTRVILTGQHREMVKDIIDLFGIVPNKDFEIMQKGQSLQMITMKVLEKIKNDLIENPTDMIIVQGDTTTAFAAALSAFYEKISICHIEAGLRSFSKYDPFPEEINRKLISNLADIHICPTQSSAENLFFEGIKENVYITGNTVIDALLQIEKDIEDQLDKKTSLKIILVTVHRRENWGNNLLNIIKAIKLIISSDKNIRVRIIMHKNQTVRDPFIDNFRNTKNIKLLEPLPYKELIKEMKKSYLILTDSGGIQEEAPYLRKPILVLRKTTERPEVVIAGNAKLVGTDKEKIFYEVKNLISNKSNYQDMTKSIYPYGDGKASEKILSICFNYMNKKD